MQRRGDEALLGQTPEGIEAAAAGKRNSFGIAEGDVAGAVGVSGEEDLPVHLPQQAQKRLEQGKAAPADPQLIIAVKL